MAFYIDKQTLDDLNIFSKRGRGSIYDIFNVARTCGGATALEAMFRTPLSDPDAINRRSAVIRRMAENRMEFPFEGELFNRIEYYLSDTDSRTALSGDDNTLLRRLRCSLGLDAKFERVYKGVSAAVVIVRSLREFIGRMQSEQEWDHYGVELAELAASAGDPDFDRLCSGKRKLSFAKTAELDTLIRFTLHAKFRKLLDRIYRLDVYISVAEVAVRRGYAFAEARPGGELSIDAEGMHHPQIKDAVPNSLRTDASGNVLFLTGANMAGKSTLMKTLGLTVFLAHVGFPVPARRMEFSALDGMYATINLPDNLTTGYSHFYAEVMRTKQVAGALGMSKRLLIIFDELFRGTNVKDAYDATVAITQAFAEKKDCLFVISTHIIEAGDELRKLCGNVRFVYLPTIMDGNSARYPYTLAEGITSDRHGMMIINNENVVDIIRQGGRRKDRTSAERFTVDKQTLDDLNILGEYRKGSVFGEFNRTRTRGGKKMMEEMFRHPLTDAAQINARTAIFSYFRGQRLEFPADRERVDRVEQYLFSGIGGSRLSFIVSTLARRALWYINRNKEYEFIKQGMDSTISFIAELREFIRKPDRSQAPEAVKIMFEELDALMTDKRLTGLLRRGVDKRSWFDLAADDHTLRSLLQPDLQRMMKTIYELDIYLAVSDVSRERNFVHAAANGYNPGNNRIDIEGLYHPGLPAAVDNTVRITADRNVVFLTGANMAGKSTLMKSFGIALYLAHMGFPVAAAKMDFTVQDGMYTSINVSDDLTLGYSHFYAEVMRVKHVAEEVASGKNLFVVFDELFKGTNVKDAFDATVAVTDAFGGHANCSYIISTHIIEAGTALAEMSQNMQFVYMPTVMEGCRPTYPYRLTDGITDDRHGMIIIRNEKIIETIKKNCESA